MSSDGREILVSYNPTDGSVVGEVPITEPAAIPGIVEEARAAAAPWRAMSLQERASCLNRAGELLRSRAEVLGEIISRETGKPLASGIGEARGCGKNMARKTGHAEVALAPTTESSERTSTTIYRDPLGVCGVISPWNFPMSMPHWMVVPALMAGNAVVLKPSEETPLSGQAYADLLGELLPEGTIRVVHGADAQGKALVNAEVNLIAFTGSREAGKHIMRAASEGLKRLVLELGGKDPLILLEDADVEAAARYAVGNSLSNSGQACISTERIFVHESIADDFESQVTALAAAYKVGRWDEEGSQIGPMIHERQREHVLSHIRSAMDQGARVLLGGPNPPAAFVEPTVITGVTDDMLIAREETFGPVLSITRFRDAEEALRSANDTPFGLGASVFGQDEERAYAIARRLDVGMVGVNRALFGVGDTPWVGAKQSGYGYHGSPDGHRQFAQTRVISRPVAAGE